MKEYFIAESNYLNVLFFYETTKDNYDDSENLATPSTPRSKRSIIVPAFR